MRTPRPKEEREIAVKMLNQGMSPKEVSKATGIPAGTVERWKYECEDYIPVMPWAHELSTKMIKLPLIRRV